MFLFSFQAATSLTFTDDQVPSLLGAISASWERIQEILLINEGSSDAASSFTLDVSLTSDPYFPARLCILHMVYSLCEYAHDFVLSFDSSTHVRSCHLLFVLSFLISGEGFV